MTLQNVAGLPHPGDPRYVDPRIPLPVRALLRALHAAEDAIDAALALQNGVTRYVRGPRALLRAKPMHIEAARTLARTDEHRIPPRLRDTLVAMETAVMSAGFGAPHRITHGNPTELRSIGSLLEHAGTGDLATIVCIQSGPPDAPKLSRTMTFTTDLADGHRLVTSSASPVMWPPQPGHDIVRFPDVDDARELYALHRFRVDDRARTVPILPATRGATEAERLAHTDREAQAFQRHLIQIGYREPAPDGLRHTVRGAILSAWRTMWPWKQWTDASLRRRAAAVRRARARAMTQR